MFLELEVDSQLELALLPGGWEEEMSVLACLVDWWLEFKPNTHVCLPPKLLLSVEH